MYESIKPETIASLRRYVDHGIRTGDFLYAVLSGYLFEAAGRADPENAAALAQIARYIACELPRDCWGSPVEVDAWLKRKSAERVTTSIEALAQTDTSEGV